MSTAISQYIAFAIYKYASANEHSCYKIVVNLTAASTDFSDNSQCAADIRYAFVFPILRCQVAAIRERTLALMEAEERFQDRLV
jgi:hypothetical protein